MLAIIIKLNILWIVLGVVVLPLIGLLFRIGKTVVEKNRIELLEREMIESHAEILFLQEKIVQLQQAVEDNANAPVVSLKDSTAKKYPQKDSGNSGGALKSLL
jgi:hypothetical protein